MSIVANSQGVVHGKFTIPAGVPAGAKLVEFYGEVGGVPNHRAAATFVARTTLSPSEVGLLKSRHPIGVVWTIPWDSSDPYDTIAQTFLLSARHQVAAVQLWVTEIGSVPQGASNVLVQIRETASGRPAETVLAESLLARADLTAGAWNTFTFTPTILEPNREYALVVYCDNPGTKLAAAGVGELDAAAGKYVTGQPYEIGTLLTATSAAAWIDNPTLDLAFRVVACDYSVNEDPINVGSTTKTVPLTSVAVVGAERLMVLAAVERPTADCDVKFLVTVGGTEYSVSEGQSLMLDAPFTGTVTWSAVLTGTYTASPVLHKDLQLVAGKSIANSDYISRAFLTGATALDKGDFSIYYDGRIGSGATVAVYVQNGEDGSGDPIWAAATGPTTQDLGDGWVEYKWTYANSEEPTSRIKLVLNGTALARPVLRNLRVAIT